MSQPTDKETLLLEDSQGSPPAKSTLPFGSGKPGSVPGPRDTIPSPPPAHAELSVQETLAAEALPPADPGTLAAMETLPATETGAPGGSTLVPSPRASMDQTTVLPEVQLGDGQPKVQVNSRRRYETQGKLGEGGVGEVVSATDHDIGRTVAIKRLHSRMKTPLALARFVEEIRTTGQLEHPNVVPIHDVGMDDNGDFYFVMKHVNGETLESIIEKLRAGDPAYHKKYGWQRRTEIFKAVLEAVNLAHSQGIVHRDIKPANIMVGAFGEVLLMDWGLAKSLREEGPDLAAEGADDDAEAPSSATESARRYETHAGALLGTPAYMSPEQANGEPADERSDIYSLSVMFHELLTLRHYLEDKRTVAEVLASVDTEEITHASFVTHPTQGRVPADLGHFAKRGYPKDPAERYQSVQEMLDRLSRRAEGHVPVECPMTLVRSLTNGFVRQLDNRPTLVLMGTLLSVLVTVSAIVYGIIHLAI